MSDFSYYSINEPVDGFPLNSFSSIITIESINLTSESNISIGTPRIISAVSASLSVESDVSASAFSIVLAQSEVSGLMDISIAYPVTIVEVVPQQMSIESTALIADLVRFTPSSRYPGSYMTMFVLDDIPLSDQNRKFEDSLKAVFSEQKNWNGDKSRYYRRNDAGKMVFKLSWEWLPSKREFTIDKREARNYIKDKAMDPDIHTLKVLSYGENPEDVYEETTYNVFITNYSENLVRRDLSTGTYFWNCAIELEEV